MKMTYAQNIETGKMENVETFFNDIYQIKLDEVCLLDAEDEYFEGLKQCHIDEAYDFAVNVTNYNFGTNGKNLDMILSELSFDLV